MADEGDGGGRSGVCTRRVFNHSPHSFQRVLLLIFAVVISVPLILGSRSDRENPVGAAFSILSSSHGYVRISGDVRHAGMYSIFANLMTTDAIKMADPALVGLGGLSEVEAVDKVINGMALHVAVSPNGTLLLTKSQIATNERLVMKIPLDINLMNVTDFDSIPGIGPKMAQRIVEYRHKNGGKMRVIDLMAINGIGEKKYKHLYKYF